MWKSKSTLLRKFDSVVELVKSIKKWISKKNLTFYIEYMGVMQMLHAYTCEHRTSYLTSHNGSVTAYKCKLSAINEDLISL